VYLGHTCGELRGQIPAAQVDIEERGLNAAMAGECRNLVDVSQPARARSVRQRWRNVCVLNRSTSARRASSRTTFDQLQIEIGSA